MSQRPAVAPTKAAKLPASADRTLGNGLRVVAVRRATVPLVEVRLRVPWTAGKGNLRSIDTHVARGTVLAETLLMGTSNRSALDVAEQLQAIGGSLDAAIDSDRLLIAGNSLASELPTLLELIADILTGAAYPAEEVAGERDRIATDLASLRSIPGVLAGAALGRRLHGEHPYARELARPELVAAVKPAALRTLHARHVLPGGSLLTLTGDVRPAAAVGLVEKALGDWGSGETPPVPPPLPEIVTGPLTLVHRPGAVQSNLRLAGPGLRRTDPDYPPLQIANVIFGGYFSSRYVANLREDKGYTYSPTSGVDHTALGSFVDVGADVATEVTAPALLETLYELGRIATLPVTDAELEAARAYAIGTLALSTSSQVGLAGAVTAALAAGLPLDWMREHVRRLGKVSVDDVQRVAARFFAPSNLVTVVVGDADVVAESLGALQPVELVSSEGL